MESHQNLFLNYGGFFYCILDIGGFVGYGIVLNAWAGQITKPALNQAGINNFNNCVVLAIQLIVLVCFYYKTTTALGCVVYNRAMFHKNAPPKTRLTDY